MQLFIHKARHILPLATLLICLTSVHQVLAESEADPLLAMVLIDEFEIRNTDGNSSLVLDSQGWFGKDIQKLWFKAELVRDAGKTQEAELQVLYSRALLPFWDVQAGLRQDLSPAPRRNWAVIGLQGLAPYFLEMDIALFIGASSRTALRLEAEYRLFLTQQLVLTPEIEMNFYGQDDAAVSMGSGLSDIALGLRLGYEIRREFTPYIGVNWNGLFGNSARFARNNGEDPRELTWVIGVRTWF